MDYEKQLERNREHGENPQPGDYWHEMFVPILVVLGVSKDGAMVRICCATKYVGRESWTWDLTKQELLTREQFKKKLMYTTLPSYFAHVVPRHMQWAVDAAA